MNDFDDDSKTYLSAFPTLTSLRKRTETFDICKARILLRGEALSQRTFVES